MKKKTKKTMSAEDKTFRRLRNREHAQLSRLRKRMLIDTLEESVRNLQEENDRLKCIIQVNLPEFAEAIIPPPPRNKEIQREGPIPSVVNSDPPQDLYDIDFINIL